MAKPLTNQAFDEIWERLPEKTILAVNASASVLHVFMDRQYTLHSTSCGVTEGKSHKRLSYRKTSRLFLCKLLCIVFIFLGCSKVPGTVGNTALQKKETAKGKDSISNSVFS